MIFALDALKLFGADGLLSSTIEALRLLIFAKTGRSLSVVGLVDIKFGEIAPVTNLLRTLVKLPFGISSADMY